jgi:hypothetical protein
VTLKANKYCRFTKKKRFPLIAVLSGRVIVDSNKKRMNPLKVMAKRGINIDTDEK